MRGIILAGGAGTRLHPVTRVMSKQHLPVYNKPMIYYPLSTLMLAGIRQVLVISTPRDLPHFRELLGDGTALGMELCYAEQPSPDGLAQAFLIGRDFIDDQPAALILGDNVFHGANLGVIVREAAAISSGARIFAYRVRDPRRYGVVQFDADYKPIALIEKPSTEISPWAVPGLYFYGPGVADEAASLRPSARGELEITDLNRRYLERGELTATIFGRGFAWFDTGTHRSLLDAANFIAAVEERQGLAIGCLEEIAWARKWIDRAAVERAAAAMRNSSYGDYLNQILKEEWPF